MTDAPPLNQVSIDETDMEQVGFATFAAGLGYVVGAAAGGPLVDRLPRRTHQIIAVAVLLEAITTVLVPYATSLAGVSTLLLLDGVGNGLMLPGLTVSLVWMWGGSVGPKMQLFSAMFLGTVVSTSLVGLDLELTYAGLCSPLATCTWPHTQFAQKRPFSCAQGRLPPRVLGGVRAAAALLWAAAAFRDGSCPAGGG